MFEGKETDVQALQECESSWKTKSMFYLRCLHIHRANLCSKLLEQLFQGEKVREWEYSVCPKFLLVINSIMYIINKSFLEHRLQNYTFASDFSPFPLQENRIANHLTFEDYTFLC